MAAPLLCFPKIMLSITVTGYVASDPRVGEVGSNKVCNFTILSNSKKSGEDITSAVDVAVWGKRADVAATYIKKGSLVTATGTGHLEAYESKAKGDVRPKVVMSASDFTLPPRQAEPEF